MSPLPSTTPVSTPTIVRKRKATLQPVKMEDIKIEYVDLCVAVPSPEATATAAIPILEGYGTAAPTLLVSPPLTPMEVTLVPDMDSDDEQQAESVKQPRKRRKLDHLTPEEKSQHRKMMNRMSAQSARDRQKALMQQQERKIQTMQQAMDALKKQNQALTLTTQTLVTQNKTLKQENARLNQRLLELETKMQSGVVTVIPGVVKQESEEESARVVATFGVCASPATAVVDNNANVIASAAAARSCGSIPLEPAALHAIPLQKGLEEPLQQCPQQQQRSQQPSCPSSEEAESAQSQKVTSNQAAILLLLMSYLGFWTHLNSCKSLENSLSKFSEMMKKKPSSVSEKSWSKLETFLQKWLKSSNQLSLTTVKQEPITPPLSPVPG